MTVKRVLFVEHRVDFRKSFDGLLGEAYRIGARPYHGPWPVAAPTATTRGWRRDRVESLLYRKSPREVEQGRNLSIRGGRPVVVRLC
ncbi:MAG: hypothetical protein HYV07_27545 [Deltaproteobacteria bacterium]|nr:hypothetical protein [Deltaproteobacteria bacterium]